MKLLPQHQRMIFEESAISEVVAAAAGLHSVTNWKELLPYGFPEWQAKKLRLTPESAGLLFPSCGPMGLSEDHGRVRLDIPVDGLPRYVQPSKTSLRLYIPPTCQPSLKTCCAKFISEGERKALSIASLGECAIGLAGVTGSRGRNSFGGLKMLADWEEIVLNDSRSYICFDSDTAHNTMVAGMMIRLRNWVKDIRKGFPFVVIVPSLNPEGKTGIDDFIASGKNLLDIVALANSEVPDIAAIRAAQEALKQDPNGPPIIETNGVALEVMTAAAMTALSTQNQLHPHLFIRSGSLVHVPIDERGRPGIRDVDKYGVRHYFERSAKWISTSEKRGRVCVPPRLDVCEDALVNPGNFGLPALAGTTSAPTFAPDGTLLDKPGYQPQTRMFYQPPPDFVLPDTAPTPGNVRAAKAMLVEDLFGDFPFADPSSRAHAIGLTILPFVRPMLRGATPLHLWESSTPGTGKGLGAAVSTIPYLGRPCDARTAPLKAEEFEKTLHTVLACGAEIVLFDNVRNLNSATFEAMLTAPDTFTSRTLGANTERTFPVLQVWIATANNLTISGDMARRYVPIRLDARMERPEERTGFKHDPLEAWAIVNRAALAGACITLVRSWVDAGMPAFTARRKGSFERWCSVIGGILQHHGIPGFLENTDSSIARMDPRPAMWTAFLEKWRDEYGIEPKGVADVHSIALTHLADEFGTVPDNPRAVSTRIGNLLRSHVDRVFGRYRLRLAGTKNGAAQYKIEEIIGSVNEPMNLNEPRTAKREQYPENGTDGNIDTAQGWAEKVHEVPEVHSRPPLASILHSPRLPDVLGVAVGGRHAAPPNPLRVVGVIE